MSSSQKKYLIAGAGFTGAVIAEQLSRNPENKILILEEREHIGGNCYTERDAETGVMVHKYGPHIFNTDNEEVWAYIQQFCEMVPFINRVKTIYKGQVYSSGISGELFRTGLCLPSGSNLTGPQKERILQVIRETFGS